MAFTKEQIAEFLAKKTLQYFNRFSCFYESSRILH